MSSVEIVRTCVRSKIACIVAELDAREALLASSSSDDDNDVRVNHLSTLLQLDDESLTIERHKIRDALSVPTLSETSWISIFQRGFMQLPREHRQLLRHIARYSTASKCTLYCTVGDKDVHLKYTKYITAIVCTPLTLLHDVENGMIELLEVLIPNTAAIPVIRFLSRELVRFLDDRTSLPRNSTLVLLPLSFRYPDCEYDRITCVAAEIRATADRRILNVRARACKHVDTPSGKTVTYVTSFCPDSSAARFQESGGEFEEQLRRQHALARTIITESPCRPTTHEFRILKNGPSSYSRPALIVHSPVYTFR